MWRIIAGCLLTTGILAAETAGERVWKNLVKDIPVPPSGITFRVSAPEEIKSLDFELSALHGGNGWIERQPVETPFRNAAYFRVGKEGTLILRSPIVDYQVALRNQVSLMIASSAPGYAILRYGSQADRFRERHQMRFELPGKDKPQKISVPLAEDLLRLHLLELEIAAAPGTEVALGTPELNRWYPVPAGKTVQYPLPLNQWVPHQYGKVKTSAADFSGMTSFRPQEGRVSFLFSPKGKYRMGAFNELIFELESPASGYGLVFYRTANNAFSDERRVQFPVTAGKKQLIRVPLPGNQEIEQLRLDTLHKDQVRIHLSSPRLVTAEKKGESAPEMTVLPDWPDWKCRAGETIPQRFVFSFSAGIPNRIFFPVPWKDGKTRDILVHLQSSQSGTVTLSAPKGGTSDSPCSECDAGLDLGRDTPDLSGWNASSLSERRYHPYDARGTELSAGKRRIYRRIAMEWFHSGHGRMLPGISGI